MDKIRFHAPTLMISLKCRSWCFDQQRANPVMTTTANPDIISENSNILIKLPSGNFKLLELKREIEKCKNASSPEKADKLAMVSLGKFGQFDIRQLVGKYFNSTLEILDRGATLKVLDSDNYLQDYEIDPTIMTAATNRNIRDESDKQKLSHEDLLKLKKQGLEGGMNHQEIIQAIVSNHGGFEEKTEFSKAKYIKTKIQKYSKVFVPLKPNALNMIDYYKGKGQNDKIRELRVDTLSQMLTFANIRAGSRVLCVDDCAGILSLAILERTGGIGDLVCFHGSINAGLQSVNLSNLEDNVKNSITTYAWFRFHEPFAEHSDVTDPVEKQKQANRLKRYEEVESFIQAGGFDALVVATPYNAKEILDRVFPLLAPSAKICIYDSRKEPLMQVLEHVRYSHDYCFAQLTESWMREYQVPVLASGTHPHMITSGNGGFLVSCTKVDNLGVDLKKPKMKELKAARKPTDNTSAKKIKLDKENVEKVVPVDAKMVKADGEEVAKPNGEAAKDEGEKGESVEEESKIRIEP